MKKSEYLYGKTINYMKNMGYIEALNEKISLCDDLLTELLKVSYRARDTVRINDVIKARKFNEQLIKELK